MIVVDGVFHEFKHDERFSAAEHLDYLEAQGLEKNAIIVCDRGYPGYKLYRRIDDKGYYFLMRIQKKVHSLTDGPSDNEIKDYVPEYIKDEKSVRVRVMHFILEGGEEWLVTNLLDPSLTPQDFKELLWTVEGGRQVPRIQEPAGTGGIHRRTPQIGKPGILPMPATL